MDAEGLLHQGAELPLEARVTIRAALPRTALSARAFFAAAGIGGLGPHGEQVGGPLRQQGKVGGPPWQCSGRQVDGGKVAGHLRDQVKVSGPPHHGSGGKVMYASQHSRPHGGKVGGPLRQQGKVGGPPWQRAGGRDGNVVGPPAPCHMRLAFPLSRFFCLSAAALSRAARFARYL